MTLISWRDKSLTTAGGSHSVHNNSVNHVTERMLFVLVVVPTALSHILSEDLNRGLCTVSLNLRHVKIIDEDNTLHTHTGSKNTTSNLVKFAINNILNLIATSLS